MANTCPFCDLSKVAKKVLIDPVHGVWCIVPLYPVVEGHRLFITSDSHFENAGSEPYLAGIVFEHAAEYARRIGKPFNLITSAGSVATQTVFHYHLHYVPREKDDGLKLPWSDNG